MSLPLHLYHWIDTKLNRKYILGMAFGLIGISLLFVIMFINLNKNQLENQHAKASLSLNKLLQSALENSMLKRDLGGVRNILNDFGKQENIYNIMITNTKGEVRFASKQESLGKIIQNVGQATQANTQLINSGEGNESLRSINPINNREECGICHGPKQKHPINGVIVVDMDANAIRKNTRNTTLALMAAGSTVVLIILFGGWWFMGQFVLKPVRRLLNTQQKFTLGNMQARVRFLGNDEISGLGNSFDSMADTIETQVTKLERSKKFLQSLIEGIPDGVRVLDQDNNILIANTAYAKQIGVSPAEALEAKCYAVHKRDKPCISTMQTCPLYEIKTNGKPIKVVHHHTNSEGVENSVEIFAAPIEAGESWGKAPVIIEVIRDLSKSINYSQEQRLTALGMLASGVAHEIHNPLGSIQIAFQSIDQLIESGEPVMEQLKQYIELIEGEIDKCVDVTGRLLKLGNLPDTHLQPIDLVNVIIETISLLQWEANARKIDMKVDLPDSPMRVLGTDTELRMMILNLVQNAYHAMHKGGNIIISVKNENQRIITSVSDTGVGISKEIQQRIFDPFFSHRSDNEKGTGLGLSITKTIVHNFKGTIKVSSIPGKGSTFTIILPDADSVDELSA